MNLSTATPSEIDTVLAKHYADVLAGEERVSRVLGHIHDLVGDRRTYGKRNFDLTHDEAIARAKEADTTAASTALDHLAAARAAVAEARAAMEPLHAEYRRRGGWTRAFLVTSSTGHVHSSMSCGTCNSATTYAWMTDYSGKDEAEIVEAAGERACTVCYPSAPVETLARPTRMFTPDEIEAQKNRDERAAAKAQRDADRIAKALTPDGSPLTIQARHGRETFKTERAATTWLVQEIGAHRVWDYSLSTQGVAEVIAAIAAKHGKTIEAVTMEIEKKVAAWIKRNT